MKHKLTITFIFLLASFTASAQIETDTIEAEDYSDTMFLDDDSQEDMQDNDEDYIATPQVVEVADNYDGNADEPATPAYSSIDKKDLKDLKIEAKPDKPAYYFIGMKALFTDINYEVKFPYSYDYSGNTNGYVILKFVVGADSLIYNAEVIKSKGTRFDNDALKVLGNLQYNWMPATKKGNPVSTWYYVPIRYYYKDNYEYGY
ncbi:MAG: energy transducer TonB [Bacteroidia bacterium]|nr:energy transducer TonB [Bacteroidia bacterium]